MKIARLNVVTLGVRDLKRATTFYEAVLCTPPNLSYEGITFFEFPGTWVSLFPLENLARDISSDVSTTFGQFNGITLAYNARTRDDVVAIMETARLAGAIIIKEPQETSWGGFNGYFSDLDGYYWEVVWGPMFEFTESGELRLPSSA